ncbi:hypothetical protein BSZ35_11555 [Salinibacter sp. 10B]|uniref:hypothetical protein n=1 Tax=Salinibacter sp. 10B TaxID=1923971 RepID=UPI000CF3B269|nr:hypothetical protein [Salinibacter sp. 10B]PQJ35146.1 hypothetical protein BSZ35_11555 [Salinibacter sp. 10B]
MNTSSEDTRSPDPFQNPYHPFEEPECYRAFREGWDARQQDEGRTQNPYPMSDFRPALSWLDGWTVADWTERKPRDGTVLGRHWKRERSTVSS